MKIRTLHFIFLGLLLIIILFELTFFLKFKPFYYFSDINQEQYDFVTDMLLERKLMKMPLEEKVGALFIIGFNGAKLDAETERFIKSHYFTHFLLLGKNIQDKSQLKSLTSSLCKYPAPTSDHVKARSLQCLISIDQEGGRVNRINFGNIDNTAQSEIKTPQQAYEVAKNRGEILKSLGINLNFSPVAEVLRNENSFLSRQERAFLGDEEKAFRLSQAMIKGYQDAGIISAAKHFPGGLGRQKSDPHQTLPVLNISQQELNQDLTPFKKLIQANQVKAIMTTHILYPQIDPENPVTTSEKFISSILRGDLGFKGAVITDDLIMKGINSQLAVEEAAKRAILAGYDLLIISGPAQTQDRVYQALLQAVRSGEISLRQVNESLKRILLNL